MKKKVLALVSTLLVCGSVGAYAASGSTYFSGKPAQAVLSTSATSAKSCPSSISSALNQVLAKKSSGSSCANSSAVQAAKAAASKSSAKSAASCPSAAAPAGSKSSASSASVFCQNGGCASKTSCQTNSCTDGTTCSNGNCTGSSNCAGNVYTYVTSPSGGSYSDWLNSILSRYYKSSCPKTTPTGTTSSKVTSSAPAASSKPASSSSASGSGYSAFQTEVVNLVNQERTSRGLGALSVSSALTNTATLKSQDMAKNNYFSHTSPTYGSPFDMMKQFGISYRTAGENIAMGQTTPAQVMNAWMNSEGHRANILNSSFTKIGVGVARNTSGQYYWTQQFIG